MDRGEKISQERENTVLWKDKGETRTRRFDRERNGEEEHRRECGEGQLTLKAIKKSRRNLVL